MGKEELSARQERFVNGIVRGLSGKQAAIEAGYSAKTAEATASRMLRIVKVKAAIDERRTVAAEKAVVDASFVMTKLREVVEVGTRTYQKVDFMGDPLFAADGQPVLVLADSSAAVQALKTLGQFLEMGKQKGDKDETISSLAETLRGLINGPK